MAIHKGGCHCGKVQFEVDAPADLKLSDCNCSICQLTGYRHLIVSRSAFRLLQGEDELSNYQFNTRVAQHYFCRHCGIKSFYVPRSHPEGISVNARCLSTDTVNSVELQPFDGQNWEQNHAQHRPLEE
jgi:hypothetical protein